MHRYEHQEHPRLRPEDPCALRVSTAWGQLRRDVRWRAASWLRGVRLLCRRGAIWPHAACNATLQTSIMGCQDFDDGLNRVPGGRPGRVAIILQLSSSTASDFATNLLAASLRKCGPSPAVPGLLPVESCRSNFWPISPRLSTTWVGPTLKIDLYLDVL